MSPSWAINLRFFFESMCLQAPDFARKRVVFPNGVRILKGKDPCTMSFSPYVTSYPISAYIVGHLGLSVADFCRRYEFDPTIVSGWQTANRSVSSLPADFVECLAIASDKTTEQVRCILRLLETQHFAYLATNPEWNITPSPLASPVSSQKTQ